MGGGTGGGDNQLARWFSPELLARASAGKLPSVHVPNALSLEDLERHHHSPAPPVRNWGPHEPLWIYIPGYDDWQFSSFPPIYTRACPPSTWQMTTTLLHAFTIEVPLPDTHVRIWGQSSFLLLNPSSICALPGLPHGRKWMWPVTVPLLLLGRAPFPSHCRFLYIYIYI